MSNYDIQYNNLVNKIIDDGIWDDDQEVRPKWADGTSAFTKSVISHQLTFDNKEVPILTTKRVAWKTAIHELLWFYVHRTSDVSYLRENNVKIWEEWTREDGTIGKAYGYQLGKPMQKGIKYLDFEDEEEHMYLRQVKDYGEYEDQVQKLIRELKDNPASRRHIISLWNIDDAWDMALQPCVWHCHFIVKQGKLHLIVGIRSNDVALGQPLNVFQYHVLQRMVAQVTGYELGTLTFNINDVHIYERHLEAIEEQVSLEPYGAPTLWINPEIKNFDDFTIDDFQLMNYNYHPSVSYEVAQ